jgi:DNA-binding SARP family transcriptional activator
VARMRLHVLGGQALKVGAGSAIGLGRSSWQVIAYLLTRREARASRDELAEILWADRDSAHARRCFSTALWRLHRAIGDMAKPLVVADSEQVALNWDAPLWVDCLAMAHRIEPLLKAAPESVDLGHIRHLRQAVQLYRGPFFATIDDEWAWIERQRLRNLYCEALLKLAFTYAAAGQWQRTIEWAAQLNREEPLREDVHRLLIEAYRNSGNRAKAVAQYRACEAVLRDELGVEPMPETQRLFNEMVTAAPAGSSPLSPPPLPHKSRLEHDLGKLNRLLGTAQQRLARTLEHLHRNKQ